MKLPGWLIAVPAVLFLAGCALVQSPAEYTRGFAATAGFAAIEMPDSRVRAFVRRAPDGARARSLTIYIEGDGAPWLSPATPPADPTPTKPLVLRMAIADPSPVVAYMGRPCQHLDKGAVMECDYDLWTDGRYGEVAVRAMGRGVDSLKQTYGAQELNLVGYSGGGAIAALLAARRGDVKCLVTVASPLDTAAWTRAVGVSPLSGSLNPADSAANTRTVAQTHFQGGRDRIVPPPTTRRFLDQNPRAQVIGKDGFDHYCCWDAQWKELWTASCLAGT